MSCGNLMSEVKTSAWLRTRLKGRCGRPLQSRPKPISRIRDGPLLTGALGTCLLTRAHGGWSASFHLACQFRISQQPLTAFSADSSLQPFRYYRHSSL